MTPPVLPCDDCRAELRGSPLALQLRECTEGGFLYLFWPSVRVLISPIEEGLKESMGSHLHLLNPDVKIRQPTSRIGLLSFY